VHWKSILTELYLRKRTKSSRRAAPQCRQIPWWSYAR